MAIMKLERFDKYKKEKILVVCGLILIFGILIGIKLYKSHAFYEDNKTFNVIRGKIPYFTSGDVQVSYTIDGEVASTFPTTKTYNVTVDCGDTATAEWDKSKWALFVSNATADKVKCTVSFETRDPTLAEYITALAETDTTNLAYDGTSDNNLRYIGADPSNYLCFDEDCSNGKWRVIGIMNNIETESNGTQSLVKIIRADNVGKYAWDSNNVNDWDTSSLKDELNSGDLYETYIKGYDNLFESVIWNLGGWSSEYTTTSNWYTYERGTTVYSGRPTTWTGKIALMYPSDYGYATSGGSTTDRATCLSINMNNSYWGNSSYSNCKNNDYLYNSSYRQWTLTPYSSSSYGVFCVGYTGYVGFDVAYAYGGAVRPVGYLKSDLTILNGDGSSGNPWIISES
jgi:hypothetical protein